MKKLWVMLLVVFSVVFLVGCGDAVSSLTGGSKANVLTEPGLANKIIDELKNRDELKGHDLKAMSDISFNYYKELGNRVEIHVQKPGTTDKVDAYIYQDGKWSGPQPVQLTGDGVLADNVGAQTGLGYIIIDSRNQLRIDILIATIITIGIIGMIINALFGYIEKVVSRKYGYDRN